MQEKNISQAKLSELTGIGKSSISQYMSGKNTPSYERRKEIAVALGLNAEYFEEHQTEKVKIITKAAIPKLTPEEAAKLMGVAHQTVREGLKQERYPWGYAVKTSENEWTYWINAKAFAIKECIDLGF